VPGPPVGIARTLPGLGLPWLELATQPLSGRGRSGPTVFPVGGGSMAPACGLLGTVYYAGESDCLIET